MWSRNFDISIFPPWITHTYGLEKKTWQVHKTYFHKFDDISPFKKSSFSPCLLRDKIVQFTRSKKKFNPKSAKVDANANANVTPRGLHAKRVFIMANLPLETKIKFKSPIPTTKCPTSNLSKGWYAYYYTPTQQSISLLLLTAWKVEKTTRYYYLLVYSLIQRRRLGDCMYRESG